MEKIHKIFEENIILKRELKRLLEENEEYTKQKCKKLGLDYSKFRDKNNEKLKLLL